MLIENRIKKKIEENFMPLFFNVVNESHLHHGHQNQDTHFRIEIVSENFIGKSQLARHRLSQAVLKNELALIRAFSLHTHTPDEWEKYTITAERSPTCQGFKNG